MIFNWATASKVVLSSLPMWVAPFVLSSGFMVLGALIWIFLIDPEKSVVEARVPVA